MEIALDISDKYLVGATMAADHVKEIEREWKMEVEPVGDYTEIPAMVEHNAMTMTSIINSYSYLEAFVNEFYDSISCPELKRIFNAVEELTSNEFTSYSTLAKYQTLLVVVGAEPFAKGEPPFQEVAWLRNLRNYLIHYERDYIVTSQSREEQENKLERALRDRIAQNPQHKDSADQYLPRLAMSFSCCEWAILSSIDFVEEFRSRMGDRRVLTYLETVESILDE